AYSMKCHCSGEPEVVVDHLRLFRNDPLHRWQFHVHEQMLPAVRSTGATIQFSDVLLRHIGYAVSTVQRGKAQRNLRLLWLDHRDYPDHPYVLFNLGSTLRELGRPAEALPYLQRSLALSHPEDSISRKLYALVGQSHLDLARPQEALAICATGRSHYPDDP